MSTISEDEARRRLSAIANGPWAEGARMARRKIAPPSRVHFAVAPDGYLILDTAKLSPRNKLRSTELARTLRLHYKDNNHVTDPNDIKIRAAMDDALTLPQLYELAVQTGYLPVERIEGPARELLSDLLWSEPARNFVAGYGFLSVQMLAARVKVASDDLGKVRPPEPIEKSAMLFAGFLAHLRAFYSDPDILIWTAFLDDFEEERDEHDRFWEYLRGKRPDAPSRTQALIVGCQAFVTSLATVYHTFDEDELGRFALVHAYWLQKFFGYRIRKFGYERDADVWGTSDSWATTFEKSRRWIDDDLSPKVRDVIHKEFVEDVATLRTAFTAVRSLIGSTRTNRESGTTRVGRALRDVEREPI
jgi:hypothetical protein